MKKRQYEALLREMRWSANASEAHHAHIANSIEDLRVKLNVLERHLSERELTGAPLGACDEPAPPKEYKPTYWDPARQAFFEGEEPSELTCTVGGEAFFPLPPVSDTERLHTYCYRDDGTIRECDE